MTTKPQLNTLLQVKSSRTRRKSFHNHTYDRAPLKNDRLQVMEGEIRKNLPVEDRLSPQKVPKTSHSPPRRKNYPYRPKLQESPIILIVIFNLLFLSANANVDANANASNSTNLSSTPALTPVVPTSVSKAYTHIPTLVPNNISRSSISRPFYTRMTPGDAKLPKPSKLFTNGREDDAGFDQGVFDSTTEPGVEIEATTNKRGSSFSPFLTQTDTGPKIRLEPFFNILTTFQSLALGSSKEQKFSPSYQAVAQSVGVAEAQLKARQEERDRNRNKGVKGLRNKRPKVPEIQMTPQFMATQFQPLAPRNRPKKNKSKGNKFTPIVAGPLQPLPEMNPTPSVSGGQDDDIITAESLGQDQDQNGALNPLGVLSVSMSTSMSLGGGHEGSSGPLNKSKGTVEDVPISQPQPESLISITTPSLGLGFTPILSEGGFSPSGTSKSAKKRKNNRKHFSFTQQQAPQTPQNLDGTLNATDSNSGPESRERRLRSETHFFENFHESESSQDLLAEESHDRVKMNTNIPSGYALPKEEELQEQEIPPRNRQNLQFPQDLASKYPLSFAFHPQPPPQLPPPGLGLPPKSFFSLNSQSIPKRPSFSPNINSDPNNYHNYGNSDNYQSPNYDKPPEASSDLGEQQNVADSKLEVFNPHQKIGIMDGFEIFYKQYKILAWGGFFVITTLALGCLIVYLYTNSPPTEVVTAKGLLAEWISSPSPQLLTFLSSIYEWNEKGGGSGKGRRKRFKMKKRRRTGNSEDFGL